MDNELKISFSAKWLRRIVASLSFICLVLGGLCGCYETSSDTIGITDESAGSDIAATDVTTGSITEVTTTLEDVETVGMIDEITTAPGDDAGEKVFSPESAVDVYMDNIDVWMEKLDYTPMNGYGYCLIDIDLDGTLELISSVCDGSGRFSYNKYFRIDPESRSVEGILLKDSEINCTYDYYLLGSDDTMLLKDNDSGEVFYLCTDFIRATGYDFSYSRGKMYLENDRICIEYVFDEYEHKKYPAEEDFDYIKYYLMGDGESVEVSEEEYRKVEKTFFDGVTDLGVSWGTVSGDEFAKADSNDRKQLLLDAYRSFSYNGFSFSGADNMNS